MNNMGNMVSYYSKYLFGRDPLHGPIEFHTNSKGPFLSLKLNTKSLYSPTELAERQDFESEDFEFRLYNHHIYGVELITKEKIHTILTKGASQYHCYPEITENGGLIVDIPTCFFQHKGDISKIILGIRDWMIGFESKVKTGNWF